MSTRNAWRFAARLARVLAVPDAGMPSSVARPTVLLSCSDVDRGMTEGGRRYSPLLEGVRQALEGLGYAAVNLTHPYAVFGSDEVKGYTITLNRKMLEIRLIALGMSLFTRNEATAIRLEREALAYVGLLQKLQPEIVIGIQPAPALCDAGKRCGIKVVEVLHGTHIHVNDRIFQDYMGNRPQLLADAFLAFDEVTQATWKTLCAGRPIKVLRADDPWLHACRRQQARAAHQHIEVASRCKKVLVTLQWGYDGERNTLSNIIPNGILHPAIETAMAMTDRSEVAFLVRMHPIQMIAPGYRHHRRYVEALAARFSHVEIERATAQSLPLLLDEVSAHLTMSSSAVGEAAAAGVPSLALCPTLKPGGAHAGFFSELEHAGLVTFGELDARAIVSWIERSGARSGPCNSDYDVERRHAEQQRFYADLMQWAHSARLPRDITTAALMEDGACKEMQ